MINSGRQEALKYMQFLKQRIVNKQYKGDNSSFIIIILVITLLYTLTH